MAGAAGGAYLGLSAVASINPIYFSEPADSFHADLVANRTLYGEAPALAAAKGDQPLECIGCGGPDYPEEYRPDPDRTIQALYAPAPVSAEPRTRYASAGDAHDVMTAPAPDPDRAQVERYASFAVAAPETALGEAEDQRAVEETPALD
jgi:hypothetical protein